MREVIQLDPTDLLKAYMSEAVKGSGFSRAQIVDEMNRLSALAGMGARISEAMIDKWLAKGSREHIISVRMLPVFCQAVGSYRPLQALFPAGVEIVAGEDLKRLQWARAEVERRKATKRARQLAGVSGFRDVPVVASTAHRRSVHKGSGRRDDLPPPVSAASRAGGVRQLRAVALRAVHERRRGRLPLRAP